MESKTHISVKNLTVWYGGHKALDGITIDIHLQQVSDRLGIEAKSAPKFANQLVKIEALMNGV